MRAIRLGRVTENRIPRTHPEGHLNVTLIPPRYENVPLCGNGNDLKKKALPGRHPTSKSLQDDRTRYGIILI